MTTKFRSATDWTTWLTFIFTIAVSYGPMLFVGFDWIRQQFIRLLLEENPYIVH
jgi:hypothetical protein